MAWMMNSIYNKSIYHLCYIIHSILFLLYIFQIIIHGDKDAADTKELLSCVHSHFLPNKVLIRSDGDSSSFLSTKLSLLSTLEKKDGKATAYVCENYTCELPVNTTAELETLLKKDAHH